MHWTVSGSADNEFENYVLNHALNKWKREIHDLWWLLIGLFRDLWNKILLIGIFDKFSNEVHDSRIYSTLPYRENNILFWHDEKHRKNFYKTKHHWVTVDQKMSYQIRSPARKSFFITFIELHVTKRRRNLSPDVVFIRTKMKLAHNRSQLFVLFVHRVKWYIILIVFQWLI